MTRCAIYARYSSDLQSPTSIEDQVALCRTHAEREGWVVVEVFADADLHAFGSAHRPAFQQLARAAASRPRPFDVILVEDLSRMTRELAGTMTLYHRLLLLGVTLVGVSDGIVSNRPGAKMQIALKGLMNEAYLDDLAAKTHRGLTGSLARGRSTGGRLFGYRSVAVADATAAKHATPATLEIDPAEAEIVRRIFRDYAQGRSMKAITHALNQEGVPFPAKDTKRGPARRGWAVTTIQVILRNEKYAGVWVWNKTRFLKDPETGRRRPIPRPPEEWIRQERPGLRLIDAALWDAVQARFQVLADRFACAARRVPGAAARVAYSSYLLSGLLRCGVCGARMIAQTATRDKRGIRYRYGWYRCGFAANKGPAVCTHGVWYRQERLEGELLQHFRAALTPAMLTALASALQARIAAAERARGDQTTAVKQELLQLEREAGHLVRFLAQGGESTTVRAELQSIEHAVQGLRQELAARERPASAAVPSVEPAWIAAKLEHLDDLLRTDPIRAKAEVGKHLEGDLVITPLPSEPGERRAQITGRVKSDSLLKGAPGGCLPTIGCGGWI